MATIPKALKMGNNMNRVGGTLLDLESFADYVRFRDPKNRSLCSMRSLDLKMALSYVFFLVFFLVRLRQISISPDLSEPEVVI